MTWSRWAAGQHGTDLHAHGEHVVAFYVLDGELTVVFGPAPQTLDAAAGTYVAIPPGVQHGFSGGRSGVGTWLNLHAPDAGFAGYLRGLRDGTRAAFDMVDAPADGGLPADRVLVAGPGEGEPVAVDARSGLVKGAGPGLRVVEWDGEPPRGDGELVAAWALGDGRVLGVHVDART